jgi:hypothetical protein
MATPYRAVALEPGAGHHLRSDGRAFRPRSLLRRRRRGYRRLVRMTLRVRTPTARHGAISDATRNGGPEFQGVAMNQPTRGSVPRATAAACHLARAAATKNAAAPSSTNDPSPIETPRSQPCSTASRKHPAAKSAYRSPAATSGMRIFGVTGRAYSGERRWIRRWRRARIPLWDRAATQGDGFGLFEPFPRRPDSQSLAVACLHFAPCPRQLLVREVGNS